MPTFCMGRNVLSDECRSRASHTRVPLPLYGCFGTNELHVSAVPAMNTTSQRLTTRRTNIRHSLHNLLLRLQLQVILLICQGDSPPLRDHNLLMSRGLVAGTAECLLNDGNVDIPAADGEENLADVDMGNGAVGFTPCTTHASLKPAIIIILLTTQTRT